MTYSDCYQGQPLSSLTPLSPIPTRQSSTVHQLRVLGWCWGGEDQLPGARPMFFSQTHSHHHTKGV